ncbi:hypothetical protein QA649_08870 [Bradyrhizobium sp. CB1717]|uniref:hypothetical protein n=1 Tax=Bradyrhizobium sp. CB1717 TaxID=3039154 RepID=UPI0024B2199D|nr:hypothetical protein [Bradyrhizobium sp. CB1717]WFU26302.1 hypothetical protein QA649_08870 [Bradyrhizobium sp. CB1717]
MRQMTLSDLITLADSNHDLMDGTMGPLRSVITSHDVVIGIWPDRAQPEGWGTRVLKGLPVIQEAAGSVADYQCRLTAIRCESASQAHGLALVFGDQNDHSAGVPVDDGRSGPREA